ncbi:MAG: SUMF1/EgtB/PvdO family nonheme iron enzyme [Deltaproteobacteria bacterium]|nr:SUMF1/EgtB/PvdO family nonheme iron enzyme [Deltaproteobacteria bacterium]
MRSGPQPLVLAVIAALAGTAVLMRDRLATRASDPGATTTAVPAEPSSARPAAGIASSVVEGPSDLGSSSASVAAAPSALSSRSSVSSDAPPSAVDSGGPCQDGMVLVEGSYCPAVAHFCVEPVGDDPTAVGPLRTPRRCRRFKEKLVCEGDIATLRFCIDRLEYPNLPGVVPATRASYRDAERACAVEGKRLCEVEEWTLACEGPKKRPYPTGLERDPRACNIDRPMQFVNLEALARPADVSMEVERVDGRRPSGVNQACGSHFGVLDLVGNVAEWVHDRRGMRGAPHSDMRLAGGGWEAAESTCRGHQERDDPDHRGLMTGFRCCAAARDGKGRSSPTRGARATRMP